ncbi:DUF4174 domain-containing protein [Fibrisoma montanum]|uniref:DUF4174 domain-containing protein n=1 Tax=Fibrisoma montanum TaxID=2305895 RepID=A0A418M168_9BACT|nr:DUF4174 domain-containing protein [Fibrisoma montanum]RIV19361.1 DUF4174 domain-containing protein [Fibrisoma montanum]
MRNTRRIVAHGWLWMAGLFLLATNALAQSRIEKTVKAGKWQQRILIVYAPSDQSADYRQQKELLADETAGLDDRDMLVIDALENRLATADKTYLRDNLNVTPGNFAVLLIGKDGGVKIRQTKPLATKALFATIDGMSMRQQEMRAKKRNQ